MKNLNRRTLLLNTAPVHHRDAVAHVHCLFLVVSHENGGDAAGPDDGHHVAAHLFPQARVQVGKRFVQQQQFGTGRQGPGQGHPLLLPAGKFVGHSVGQSLQSRHPHHFRHPPGAVVALAQAVSYVLLDGEVGEERAFLEHHAHAALFGRQGRAAIVDRLRRQGDSSRIGLGKAGNQAQRGGLAATAGPQQGQNPALGQTN